MAVNLDRPLAAWDVETTGVDSETDRIVSFGVVVLGPDGSRKEWQTLINPGMPIPKEASDIHGITDEMVKDSPTFSAVASTIVNGLRNKDFLLFNGRALDLNIMDAELRRCGMKLDVSDTKIIDVFSIFQQKNPRDLSACVRQYTGRDHDSAHGALDDAIGTLDSWLGMMQAHDDIGAMDLAAQHKYSLRDGDNPADLAGKLVFDSEGYLRYTFGKSKGARVDDEPGFGFWMIRQTSPAFPGSTIEVLKQYMERKGIK